MDDQVHATVKVKSPGNKLRGFAVCLIDFGWLFWVSMRFQNKRACCRLGVRARFVWVSWEIEVASGQVARGRSGPPGMLPATRRTAFRSSFLLEVWFGVVVATWFRPAPLLMSWRLTLRSSCQLGCLGVDAGIRSAGEVVLHGQT